MQASIQNPQNSYFTERIIDPLTKSPFSLSLAKILTDQVFFTASYSEKHQLLLVSSIEGKLFVYDAKAFPVRRIETQRLSGNVLHISYYPETDTLIIGCTSAAIYTYKASFGELEMVQEGLYQTKAVVEFLDPLHYAFGFKDSSWLHIGNLNDNNIKKFYLKDNQCTALHHPARKNLLFSGLTDGSVRIFVTKQLPNLKAFCSFQAHKVRKQVNVVQSLQVDGKEYVVTSGQDGKVKIWRFIKGRMRLLKVIPEEIRSLVYLEKYKMLVTDSVEYKGLCFWKLPYGKLERRLDFGKGWMRGNLLLTKDKNIIACVAKGALGSPEDPLGVSFDAVEFIQINHEDIL